MRNEEDREQSDGNPNWAAEFAAFVKPQLLSRRGVLAGLGSLSSAVIALRASADSSAAPTPAKGPSYQLGDGVQVSAGQLDAAVAKAFPLFDTASILPAFDAKIQGAGADVVLRRITTSTTVPETGEVLPITGLLAVPAGARDSLPVVSWQHGTILSFNQVPSNLIKFADPGYELSDEADSLETLFNIHRFASNGFAVIAADYLGKGSLRNGRGEAYVVKGATTQTCIDMLDAGRKALKELGLQPGKLFLNGWSQGALNTQWLHQALRSRNVPIEATAVASPFNDLNETWRFWAGRQTFPLPSGVESYPAIPSWIPLCMIVVLGSYELQYGLKGLIEAAVRAEYAGMARKYWNDYDTASIDFSQFPTGSTLLVPGYFDGFTDDRNSAFLRQLAANRATYWAYDSEIRFHYGLADEAIHPDMVAAALAAGGKLAYGVPIKDASHRATFLASLYGDKASLAGHGNVLSWFSSAI